MKPLDQPKKDAVTDAQSLPLEGKVAAQQPDEVSPLGKVAAQQPDEDLISHLR